VRKIKIFTLPSARFRRAARLALGALRCAEHWNEFAAWSVDENVQGQERSVAFPAASVSALAIRRQSLELTHGLVVEQGFRRSESLPATLEFTGRLAKLNFSRGDFRAFLRRP